MSEKRAPRIPLSFRVTPQMREMIEAAAKKSGRSMCAEVEWIIERHFDRASVFDEIAARIMEPAPYHAFDDPRATDVIIVPPVDNL